MLGTIMSMAVSLFPAANNVSTIFSLGEPRPPPPHPPPVPLLMPLSEFREFCDAPDNEAVAEVGEVPFPTTIFI